MNIANPKLMVLRTFSVAMLWLSGFTAAVFATEDPGFPRTHPLEPDAAIRSFALQEGFSFQLAASEPLITDPVAAAFDEDGRLYVVEMNDYPYTDKSTDKPGVERTTDLPIGKVRQHANAWHRETARRLLFERQDAQAVALLRRVLHDDSSDLGRLQDVDVKPVLDVLPDFPQVPIVLLNGLSNASAEVHSQLASAGNVFFDVATLEGLAGLERQVRMIPAERILYGSHAPFFTPEAAKLKLQEFELPVPIIEQIERGNAAKLLANAGSGL